MQSYSVSEITRYIHGLFDGDPMLAAVWVGGEVSNLTKARSGHWYFTIKDAGAQLRCVMFRSAARFVRSDIRAGDEILVHGRVSVYEARGEYQLYADSIVAAGSQGDLHQQFEALKARLAAEGLFEQAQKQPIPEFPRRIGVVTSPTAAAWQDIQNVLERRFPMVEVLLSPTLVQGSEAPRQIIRALERLQRGAAVDVIVLARGGGSLEDLWCFNDEGLARALAACDIPVISGVGHEIDFTIVDFVADLRAPTPSAAAELATPNREDLLLDLDRLQLALAAHFRGAQGERQRDLNRLQSGLRFGKPLKALLQARASTAELQGRGNRALAARLSRLRERLDAAGQALEAAHPQHILARGYALVSDEQGALVRSAAQVSRNQRLHIQFEQDGLQVRVDD